MLAVAAFAGRPGKGSAPRPERLPTRFLIVVPAHDEEANIRSTIESCQANTFDPALFTVFVIADNCTDETARIARDSGAVVVERTDPDRRSKGHALDYFFDQVLIKGPVGRYDAAVVIDADTVVDPGILDAFAHALADGKEWVQCYYTVRNPDTSWRTRLMAYAFSLFNGVWLLGQDQLGLSVGLKGNGMCFSTRALARFPWKAYGLTEDLEFSWMLRVAGERIHFLPDTRVYGEMLARGGQAAASQRQRWESGRKALRGKFFFPLIGSTKLRPLAKLLYLLDIVFPPIVTLLLAILIASSLHLVAFFDPRARPLSVWLLPLHGLMALALAFYALTPILVMRLPARYLGCLWRVPFYAAWKVLVTSRKSPSSWVRTRREPAASEAG